MYEAMVDNIQAMTGKPSPLPRSVTPEHAQQNSDVQAILKPRLETLKEIANAFLDTIIASLNQVPYGIRWICKQIRSLTKVIYENNNFFRENTQMHRIIT